MDKKNVNLVSRVLKIYSVLPRVPRSALTIEEFKGQVRHCYGDDIEEKSLTKAIQRDLELIPSLLSTGALSVTNGSVHDKFHRVGNPFSLVFKTIGTLSLIYSSPLSNSSLI